MDLRLLSPQPLPQSFPWRCCGDKCPGLQGPTAATPEYPGCSIQATWCRWWCWRGIRKSETWQKRPPLKARRRESSWWCWKSSRSSSSPSHATDRSWILQECWRVRSRNRISKQRSAGSNAWYWRRPLCCWPGNRKPDKNHRESGHRQKSQGPANISQRFAGRSGLSAAVRRPQKARQFDKKAKSWMGRMKILTIRMMQSEIRLSPAPCCRSSQSRRFETAPCFLIWYRNTGERSDIFSAQSNKWKEGSKFLSNTGSAFRPGGYPEELSTGPGLQALSLRRLARLPSLSWSGNTPVRCFAPRHRFSLPSRCCSGRSWAQWRYLKIENRRPLPRDSTSDRFPSRFWWLRECCGHQEWRRRWPVLPCVSRDSGPWHP